MWSAQAGGSLASSQEEAAVLGDNLQGQGGEGVGPGHAKKGGFHRMYTGHVSEGFETMVETGPDLHFKTVFLHCSERRSGGGGVGRGKQGPLLGGGAAGRER